MNTINGNFLERTIPSLKGALVTLNMGNSTSEMNLEDLATNLGAGVTSIIAGSGISVDQSTGNVTVSATGGGGGTNPTSQVIPYNNEGTFEDSYIINDAANSVLKTNLDSDKGLFLDFGNSIYTLGQQNDNIVLKLDCSNSIFQLGYTDNTGLYLDLGNNTYKLGDFNFVVNGTCFIIDDNNSIIKTQGNGSDTGLYLDFSNRNYKIGDLDNISTGVLFVVDVTGNTIKTFQNDSENGLFLDFVNLQYKFGDFSIGRQTHLLIDNNNEFVSFYHSGNQKGLKLDFTNNEYYFGDFSTTTYLEIIGSQLTLTSQSNSIKIDGDNNEILTKFSGSENGLKLSFNSRLYSFGQLNGGNVTKLEIDDANQKLILSANLETASGGDAAEKWLKVTIGTTDYLIALLTP